MRVLWIYLFLRRWFSTGKSVICCHRARHLDHYPYPSPRLFSASLFCMDLHTSVGLCSTDEPTTYDIHNKVAEQNRTEQEHPDTDGTITIRCDTMRYDTRHLFRHVSCQWRRKDAYAFGGQEGVEGRLGHRISGNVSTPTSSSSTSSLVVIKTLSISYSFSSLQYMEQERSKENYSRQLWIVDGVLDNNYRVYFIVEPADCICRLILDSHGPFRWLGTGFGALLPNRL